MVISLRVVRMAPVLEVVMGWKIYCRKELPSKHPLVCYLTFWGINSQTGINDGEGFVIIRL